MDFERACRLLEPLIPGQMRRWLKVHAWSDAETRALIEQQVRLTADRLFGDANGRVLLSLPPKHVIRGTYALGPVQYDRPRWPAGLSTAEVLQGIAVFGRSGAGKTNAIFHLLLQLHDRRVPFLFLDWKRTGRHLLPWLDGRVALYTPGRSVSPFPFNPFAPPPGVEPQAYAGLVVDQLAIAYTLGDGAVALLQRALRSCYDRHGGECTLDQLLAELEILGEGRGMHARAKGWHTSALRALRSLQFARTGHEASSLASSPTAASPGLDGGVHGAFARSLLQQSSVVELDALPQGAKRFLIPLLCLWVYHARLGMPDRERLRFVIVVEEAHHVLHAHPRGTHETVMEMILRQCREIGLGVIIVDQHPHLISSAALGNAYTTLCFNLKDPSDVARAAAATLVEDRRVFGLLPVGHAVVKMQDRWRRPFVVRFPDLDIAKGSVNDEAIARWNAERGTDPTGRELPRAGSPGIRPFLGELGRVWRVPASDRSLDHHELRFLEDVLNHPEDGVKARYRRLRFSGHRGHAIKQRLVREGWLEAAVVPVGTSRKVVLRPSRGARQYLGLPPTGTQREGVAHEYWKRRFARRLEDAGYEVQVEAPRGNGVPGAADVVGTVGTSSIAVEIETGRSDAVANVRHGLAAGYSRVVVAATEPAALARVEAALVRAVLQQPGRVELIPAWEPWEPPPLHDSRPYG
jgi:hypothetical protein